MVRLHLWSAPRLAGIILELHAVNDFYDVISARSKRAQGQGSV